MGQRFMLRVAGLPVESVHALRCPDGSDWARRVLAEERRLSARGAELSDLLHGLVKANEDDRARRGLIRLRRELFNNRLPGTRGPRSPWSPPPRPPPHPPPDMAVTTHGPPHPARLLAGRPATAGRTGRRGRSVARRRHRPRPRQLRALAGADRLRLGLLLASPTLDGQLDAYAADTSPRPGKRARKIERSLLSYLYRTACKTSPFSTFTGVALGRLTPTRTLPPTPVPRTASASGCPTPGRGTYGSTSSCSPGWPS
ncbi:lantibiotic dehydratase [Streptomyces sp. M19]